jgi:hypothetical protein
VSEIKKISLVFMPPNSQLFIVSFDLFPFLFFFFDQFLSVMCEDVMPRVVSRRRAAESAAFLYIFLKALKIDRNKNRKDTSDDRHKLAVALMLRKLKRIGTRERYKTPVTGTCCSGRLVS